MTVDRFSPEDVPFPPGESPFHCKGVLYTDAAIYYAENVSGGWSALVKKGDDPRLRIFLNQRFVVGGWYDVFPLVAIHKAAARAARQPYLEFLRRLSKWQTDRQLKGIYKIYLKAGSPEGVVKGLPGLAGRYYDFVRVEVEQTGPKVFESRAYGVPSMVVASYKATTEAGVFLALELSGARNVRHRWHPPESDGEAHGIPMSRLRREISWG